MASAKEWAAHYNLEPHPEGGYFKQTGSSNIVTKSATGLDVPLYTNIIFAAELKIPSSFHLIMSNEVFYYHSGHAMAIHSFDPTTGEYLVTILGPDHAKGHILQYEVPAGNIFASRVDEGFSVVSAMVSPGFDFREFTQYDQKGLLEKFPQHKEVIEKLTKN